MFPRYCGEMFDNDRRIIDFMNLPWEKTDKVAERCEWQDIDEVRLMNPEGRTPAS